MYFDDIYDHIDRVERLVMELPVARGEEQTGLDSRAGRFFIGEDFVVSPNGHAADYYGGMEYVDSNLTSHIGGMKVYRVDDSREDCRVSRIIDAYKTFQKEQANACNQ